MAAPAALRAGALAAHRGGVAAGLALGLFISFTPTIRVQIVLSRIADISRGAGRRFVTNPLTPTRRGFSFHLTFNE